MQNSTNSIRDLGLFGPSELYSFNLRIFKSSQTLLMFSKEAVCSLTHTELEQITRETTVVFVQEMRTTLPQDCFHWLNSLSYGKRSLHARICRTFQKRKSLLRNRERDIPKQDLHCYNWSDAEGQG